MSKKIICLILLLFAINVKAIEKDACDKNELRRLKEVASHLSFTYEFHESKTTEGNLAGSFDIIVDNITSEIKPLIIYSWDILEYDEFVPNGNGTARRTGFISGQKVKITVKAYVKNECSGQTVMVKNMAMPYINPYIGTEECNTHPEFKYCINKLMNTNVSEKVFRTEYNKYIKEQEQGSLVMEINNTKIYIFLALIIVIPLAIIIKNKVTKYIEKRKDEI